MKKLSTLLLIVLASMQAWAAAPEDGKIYKIYCPSRDNLMIAEDISRHTVYCPEDLSNKLYQYWQLEQIGSNFAIKNVYTGRYLQNQTQLYQEFRTGTSPAQFYIFANTDMSGEYYTIRNNGHIYGLHCDAAAALVPYMADSSSPGGSSWQFKAVEVSEEELAAAAAEYAEFTAAADNKESVIAAYTAFFDDELCLNLKSEYASMSDEELTAAMSALPTVLVNAALKAKNDTWGAYEKEFRVHSYEAYSDPDVWGTALLTKMHTWQNNPTGICANTADVLYVFVDDEIPADATLEIDVLTGNGARGTRTAIKKGMNIVPIARDQQTIFVIYTADTYDTGKTFADFPAIDIRIEGGVLNGYWDISRHDDADWVELSQNIATHPYMIVKGKNFIFNMVRANMIKEGYCRNTITDAIGWWDNMAEWEWGIMGLEDIQPSRFNNKLCARTLQGGYQSATHYYTQYQEDYINNLLPYERMMSNADNCWGPGHENGHVMQGAITPINCSEVSNNLFSNLVLYKLGRYTSRGSAVSTAANEYRSGLSWPSHDGASAMRMYWQLYLYYHVAGNNPEFYPTLFKLLREDPIVKVGSDNKSYINQGDKDLLHFAEKCCEASGENMTAFFEAWGFFVPMHEQHYGDYANYYLTSTQEMIDATKAKMAEYEKIAGGIEFIEDRIKSVPRTDGIAGSKIVNPAGVSGSEAGDVGHFTDFTPEKMNTVASGYMYVKSSSTITVSSGTGAVGFRVYDGDGKLLSFSNKYKISLSTLELSGQLRVVAVQPNGVEVDVPSAAVVGTEDQQLSALTASISAAATCLNMVTTTGLQVGYYYEEATAELQALYDAAKAAKENSDQSEHTYGEWSLILDEAVAALKADKYAIVSLKEKNIHSIANRSYQAYALTYENGYLSGTSRSAVADTDDSKRWEFEKTDTEGEVYIKCLGGQYITALEEGEQAAALSKLKSAALLFVARWNGDGTYSFYVKDTPELFLAMNGSRKAVGGADGSTSSRWRISIVEEKAKEYETAQLAALVEKAERISAETSQNDKYLVVFEENMDELSAALEKAQADANENIDTAIDLTRYIDALTEAIANIENAYLITPDAGGDGTIPHYAIKNIEDGTYCGIDTESTTSTYKTTVSLGEFSADNGLWVFRATGLNDNEFYISNTGIDSDLYTSSRSYLKADGEKEATAYTITVDMENRGLIISDGTKYWNNTVGDHVKMGSQSAASLWKLELRAGIMQGIEEITDGDDNTVEGIFDMTGRRIDKITAPGIYIVNGKKTLVK